MKIAILISALYKYYYVIIINLFPKLSEVDKTKSQRKTVSSLHVAITKHDM